MKIGYIASSIYRHTFEINEVEELLRQRPESRIYSFYRSSGKEIQTQRVEEIPVKIISWSLTAILSGFFYLLARRPARLFLGAVRLAGSSLPNPVYWFKNLITFFIAVPILSDAHRHGVTHLHANFGSSPATIAWLGKIVLQTTMSVAFHAFDIYVNQFAVRDPLKKQKIRDADLVTAVHRHGLEQLRALVPEANRDKFKMIRICVVFETGQKPAPIPEPPLCIAAGNLVPMKGFDVLIRAAGILNRGGKHLRLRILGEGPERKRLESLVLSEGIDDRTEFLGYYQHAELAAHLAEAAALVVPSKVAGGGHRDGIPTVIIEAWLARTPVIASLVGGMGEVLFDGRSGLEFPPNDPVALAGCISRLLASEPLRSKLVEEGYRMAKAEFSSERNVGKLLEEIHKVSMISR